MRKKFSIFMVVILCMITAGCVMLGLGINGSALVGRLLVSENSYNLVDEKGEPYSLSCAGDKNAMFAGIKRYRISDRLWIYGRFALSDK